ncbi:outer membrane beta-barrel protein [Rhizobium daejeonense]|uniref:Outer membrane beta-barrel protein n=1 Tax=Rhizobium daejeonense TaxID=240521 RepID=A0A6M1RT45_9HYPH|nr:outer membrane beta-barrel protein [Rhizobium daejeonense]NGO62229.1 outer membrane beta-barrel protein [Rhizobium daejeonense]
MVKNSETGTAHDRCRRTRRLAGVLMAGVFGLASPSLAQTALQPQTGTAGGSASSTIAQSSATTTSTGIQSTATTGANATATDPLTTAGTAAPDFSDANLTEPDDDFGRMNLRETTLDDATSQRIRREAAETDGVRLGTMVLRPSLIQRFGSETTRDGEGKDTRNYMETGLKGSLTSDWSRHELTIGGEGYWQRNFSGDSATKPNANVNADLRLDISRDTIAHITGGYSFSREDTNDPNAISGAAVQSGVHMYNGGLSVEHDFGKLRGTVGADLERWQYSDAELSDGSKVSLSDRNRLSGSLRGRIGYELSPAITPFTEVSVGHVAYDDKEDKDGYRRSGDFYAAKAGISADFGEKLRGEVGLGYRQQQFDDNRLKEIGAMTMDGNVYWSPQQGTDVNLGLTTTIDPSTTAGLSGSVIYALTAEVEHRLRSNLVARLSGSSRWTEYQDDTAPPDTVTYATGAELTWNVNRYLDLTADLSYERTEYKSAADSNVMRAMVGLTAKR